MDLSERRPGPDVVRALAMAGVVIMNYHGYLINQGGRHRGGWVYSLFDPWTGPLSTRFAATFVLTAGVGVTLMTRSSLADPERRTQVRWRLARRGAVLYVGGLWFDRLWDGTILPFYGAMFVFAAVLFTLRIRWLVSIGVAAALAAWAIRWWQYETELDGGDTAWLTHPTGHLPHRYLFDVLVNGTHPLLPWLAFFCAGIAIGRMLAAAWWRTVAIATGFTLYATGTLADATAAGRGQRAVVLLSNDPFQRGLAYTASALGTAVLAFAAVTWIADRYRENRFVDRLRRAGQLSLTIYVAHALVFELLVNQLELIRAGGLATSLTFAVTTWALALIVASEYQRRFGRGPVEQLYRAITR
jgi:uncharacterized membrane protein YeiB